MLDQIRDYKLIQKLGEGGMGTVYLADDIMLERKVAIKILNPLLTKDSHFTERFRNEAKVQASLIHPNIVALYNYFRESDNYCMVMEYVEGVTLKQLITNTGPLPEQKVVWILNQTLEAVGFAHKKGIIHRDIKPSNILITKDNTIKILDFGIAKILQDKGLTKTGTKLGTVYYMSPEQIKALRDIDHRTDIYSIGVTLYEMLSGRIPFNVDTDSDFEIMNEIVSGEIKDPREIYPHISGWLVDVLFASVEKDRDKRIQSTDEFISRLLAKEGKSETTPGADKTVIDEVKNKPQDELKTKIAPPPPMPPVQKESIPLNKEKPVKQKSSKKKIFLFGGIGLVAAVVILFIIIENSEPEPYPYDPYGPASVENVEDSVVIYEEPITNPNKDYNKPYIKPNKNIASTFIKGLAKPESRTKKRYAPGIQAVSQRTYAKHK